MIVVSPVRSDERLNLHRHNLCEVVKSIGTEAYGHSCFAFLANSLNARALGAVSLPLGQPAEMRGDRKHAPPGRSQENTDRFVVRCHSVDPSVKAASKHNFTRHTDKAGHRRHRRPAIPALLRAHAGAGARKLVLVDRPRSLSVERISRSANESFYVRRDELFRRAGGAASGHRTKA